MSTTYLLISYLEHLEEIYLDLRRRDSKLNAAIID
jgi:hypothetical protein